MSGSKRLAGKGKPSDQDEIDQRNQSGARGHRDQGIVDADVRMRARRWWAGFLSHFGGLGQGIEVLCEADHILTVFLAIFFQRRFLRNQFIGVELSTTGFFSSGQGWKAMNQQFPSWRTQNGQTLWLSGLIAAMERLSRSEWRARPVDPLELVAVRAHLARPATAHSNRGSRFSVRN
jgi:hypothetical protein